MEFILELITKITPFPCRSIFKMTVCWSSWLANVILIFWKVSKYYLIICSYCVMFGGAMKHCLLLYNTSPWYTHPPCADGDVIMLTNCWYRCQIFVDAPRMQIFVLSLIYAHAATTVATIISNLSMYTSPRLPNRRPNVHYSGLCFYSGGNRSKVIKFPWNGVKV